MTHVHRAYVQFRFGLQIYIFWYFVFVGFVFNIAAISFMVFAVVFVFWFFILSQMIIMTTRSE